jgi:hypothetical protein
MFHVTVSGGGALSAFAITAIKQQTEKQSKKIFHCCAPFKVAFG